MALGMTTPHEQDCLNHIIAGSEFLYPTVDVYLALLTGDPGETGTPSGEPTGSTRTQLTFGAAVNGEASNTSTPTIDTTGWTDTADLTHAALSVSSTAGVFNWYGALQSSINFSAGDQLTIAAGDIKVQMYDVGPVAPGAKITAAAANLWLDHSLHVARWGPGIVEAVASLHNAAPASDANEWSTGGYSRSAFTAGVPGTSGDYSTMSHTNPLSFSTSVIQTLRSWGLYQGSQLCFIRDQGSDSPVSAGSSIDAAPGTLIALVD